MGGDLGLTIHREVYDADPDPNVEEWWYEVTKSGQTAKLGPL